MSEYDIEEFLHKVDVGLAEAQHNMLVEKALHNQPVVISDGDNHVLEIPAKQLLTN